MADMLGDERATRGFPWTALATATRDVTDLDRVLQLIADSVRGLVNARYAALGIIGPDGFKRDFNVLEGFGINVPLPGHIEVGGFVESRLP